MYCPYLHFEDKAAKLYWKSWTRVIKVHFNPMNFHVNWEPYKVNTLFRQLRSAVLVYLSFHQLITENLTSLTVLMVFLSAVYIACGKMVAMHCYAHNTEKGCKWSMA